MEIRAVKPEELSPCLNLVKQVFWEFVAPDCLLSGVEEFSNFLHPELIAQRLNTGWFMLAAFDEQAETPAKKPLCAGVLLVRDGSHISLLFTAKAYFRRGIAKALLKAGVKKCLEQKPELKTLTVNASSHGYAAYRRMGFSPTGPKQMKNGIRFIPMELKLADYKL